MRKFFPVWLLVTVLLGISSFHVSANCSLYDVSIPVPDLNISLPDDAGAGVMLGPPVLSGRMVLTGSGCTHLAHDYGIISGGSGLASTGKAFSFEGENYRLFKTSVDGVGVAIGINTPYSPSGFSAFDGSNFYYAYGNDAYANPGYMEVRLIYVSTGVVPSGSYTLSKIAAFNIKYFNNVDFGSPTTYDTSKGYIGAGGLISQGVGCNLVDAQVNVDLGKILVSKYLKGVGSVSPTKELSIPLQCDSGVAIDMVVDSSGALDAGEGLLNISSNGAAGVAIQLLNGDGITPFPLGEEVRVLAQTVEGRNDIGLAARYYQVSDNVVAGKAVGTAQFTLKYR